MTVLAGAAGDCRAPEKTAGACRAYLPSAAPDPRKTRHPSLADRAFILAGFLWLDGDLLGLALIVFRVQFEHVKVGTSEKTQSLEKCCESATIPAGF
jgi:hypothetical protein